MDAIKLENLTKYYGKNRGISGVSLTVSEGEFFGFIGPNGAGKSTTIRTMMGLIKKTGGDAWVSGLAACEERKLCGFVKDYNFLRNEKWRNSLLVTGKKSPLSARCSISRKF